MFQEEEQSLNEKKKDTRRSSFKSN